MIGKKKLKENEVKTLGEYFDLIIESEINGNKRQSKEYYLKLSKKQKIEFINFCEWNFTEELKKNIYKNLEIQK